MSVVTILALILVLAAIITILPYSVAKKKSILGYRALCPFAPISSVVLVVIAGVVWLIGALA